MRHVDDGTLHAWLDGQVGDAAEAAWIEQHVRICTACAARLAEERSTFDQANAVLATAAPPVAAPPFSEIAARAAGGAADGTTLVTAPSAQRHAWMLPLAWAASLVLAVGLGWLARDVTDSSDTAATPEATQARATETATAVPVEQPAAPAPMPQAAPAPTAKPQTSREPRGERPAPPSPAAPPAEPPARREAMNTAPAPASPGAGAGAAAPEVAVAPAAAPPPLAERVTVTGATSVPVADAAAPATGWRTLSRTEAAAATGMPLYGIQGLDPVTTMVSGDGRTVRTSYRLASGELVELEQRRPGDGAPPPPTLQQRARALAGAAAGGAPAAPRLLSVARGDVQLTLRTSSDAPDLNALATRLRVD